MNDGTFDSKKIEDFGWRQGSILNGAAWKNAHDSAPSHIQISEKDWLIISSHDCDIANFSLKKEPVVEVIRAKVCSTKALDKQQTWGRNPRSIQFEGLDKGQSVLLGCNVHDRWTFPRQSLLLNGPCQTKSIDTRIKRVIAEWLAKRYIRAAFPSQFDSRWKGERSKNLKKWTDLLESFNRWIQGIYLRLNTNEELHDSKACYRCALIVAVPKEKKNDDEWPRRREKIESDISKFWSQFEPSIICDGVEVMGSDEITLADIEFYQRFDADWLSFSEDDELPVIPIAADLKI
jgi:hypothetical protein